MVQNGHVFVFTGLISVSDIHQLSFLLGHEIAHAVLEHAVSTQSERFLVGAVQLAS